jgi:nitroreductase
MKTKCSIILVLVLALTPFLSSASVSDEAGLFEVIMNRRSVRSYKADPVPRDDLLKVLDAARMAPTSGNQQPWMFLVIDDAGKIGELKNACMLTALDYYGDREEYKTEEGKKKLRAQVGEHFGKIFSAPVYIVVLTDNQSKYPTYNIHDGPLAAGYLMLAARALGYGTVYMTDSIPEEVTKSVLKIPDRYKRVCITPLGIPEEWPETPEKKDLEEFVMFGGFGG